PLAGDSRVGKAAELQVQHDPAVKFVGACSRRIVDDPFTGTAIVGTKNPVMLNCEVTVTLTGSPTFEVPFGKQTATVALCKGFVSACPCTKAATPPLSAVELTAARRAAWLAT